MVKWRGREQSANIEDRRDQGGFTGGGLEGLGGSTRRGGLRLPVGRSGGMGSIVIIVIFIVVALMFGVNPLTLLTGETSYEAPLTRSLPAGEAGAGELTQFVGVMAKSTETYWTRFFSAQGDTYRLPKVVLFSGRTQSGCGVADRASGPFYCPGDQKIYIDLAFYEQLHGQFGAPGDFAQAYVIAHEVGHHVQQLIGVLPEFNQRRQTMSPAEANAASVQVELQADCFAGAWARSEFEQGFLEDGDLEEAIRAANQIGDDRLSGGRLPKSQYTHGSSAERMAWFRRGYESGDPAKCDTSEV